MRMRISVYLQSGMAAFYFFVFFTDLCEQIDIGLTVFLCEVMSSGHGGGLLFFCMRDGESS